MIDRLRLWGEKIRLVAVGGFGWLMIKTEPLVARVFEPEQGDYRKSFHILIVGLVLLIAAVFFVGILTGGTLGAFGDFIGGVLNPLLTFLTIIGLLVTIISQQRELKTAREEVNRQTFETMFFQMLNLHNSILNSLDLRNGNKIWNGRDCFKTFYEYLAEKYLESAATLGNAGVDDDYLNYGYNAFWDKHQKDLAHYFRFLFNFVKIVATEAPDARKRTYMKILRAQLSDYELLVLFYNAALHRGEKFKPFIEEFTLFNNLPKNLLIKAEHENFFGETAFEEPHSGGVRVI